MEGLVASVSGVSASFASSMSVFSLSAVCPLLMDLICFFSMLAVWPLALACYERYIYIYIYIYIVCNMPLLKGCGAVCPLFVFRI